MDTIITRNNVKIKGKGSQPMMFAHGVGCDQHSWQFRRPVLGEFLTSTFCTTDPEIARSFAKTTSYSDNRADLKAVKISSLTLQCKEHIIAPEQVGQFMKKNTPQNTLCIMQTIGHCPHISEPGETISAIKNFLK